MQKVILVFVGVMLLAAAPALAGGGEKGDWEFGPYAGFGWLDDYGFLHPKDDALYGLRVGKFFTPNWSFEASFQRLSTETDVSVMGAQNQDADLYASRVNMLYNFAPGSHFRPFVTLGAGYESFDAGALADTSGLGLNAGGGLRMFMTDHVGIRLDARYVSTEVGGQVDDRQGNVEASLGLTFAFGGGPPPDSDSDGVSDRKDDCPDTPRGATVDASGCPKDSDGDGVFDGIDRCPDTPKGVTVDASGCPKDSDGDGVFDGIDQCPDTPKGAKVDAKGCPKDSDGDGVFDGIDQCPDTPGGAKVDARGCPIAAPPPIVQQLLDKKPVVLEGVEFDFDKATLRPLALTILDKVAASLKEWPDLKVEVQGHTDSTGSSEHNLELSNRRAASVKAYLVSKGIGASRLKTKGYGEDRPIADNATKEGQQKNRRVELHKIN